MIIGMSNFRFLLRHHLKVRQCLQCITRKNYKATPFSFLDKDGIRPSYYHRVGNEPLLPLSFNQVIDATVDKYGNRMSVVDRAQGIRKTYQQIYSEIESLAAGFVHLKCKPGDRIAIWSQNKYEWITTQMAAVKTGLILVPLNAAFQPPEVDYCLSKMGIKTIVMSEEFKTQNFYKHISTLVPEIQDYKPEQSIKSKKYPHLENIIVYTDKSLPGTFKYNDIMQCAGSEDKQKQKEFEKKIRFDDPVIVLMTSGTTGRPKGATLSHIGVINTIDSVSKLAGYYNQPDVFCCFVPLFHGFGAIGLSMMSMQTGTSIVIPSHEYNTIANLNAIEEEKCTVASGTPTMLLDLMTQLRVHTKDVSSITTVFTGGAPITQELVRQFYSTFSSANKYIIGYGLSETSAVVSFYNSRPDDGLIETSGKLIEHVEAKIVDENDDVVPIGNPGEICTRGFHVMKEYWEDEAQTKKTLKDGWLHTGDIGTLSADGYISILSRKSDMIIRGGTNIYPKEIEDVLVSHPKIADAHVIGVPDKRLGEDVCAWVKVKPNETLSHDDIKEFCQDKIAHYKIPKYVKFVDDFPKTASGKVFKLKMREEESKAVKN